jgi:hypothetical protein
MLAEYLAQSRKVVAIMSGKEIGTFTRSRSSLAKPPPHLNAAQALIRADARENSRKMIG